MTDPFDGAVERRNMLVEHALQSPCPQRDADRRAGLAEEAFLAGRLTQCQILALAPMLRGEGAAAWVERAAGMPVHLLKLLQRADACLAFRFPGPFPMPGLVILSGFDEPPPLTDGMPADLAQTCAPLDGREKISVWLPVEIGADLQAAIVEIRRRSGEILPVWVALTILLAQASEEWEKTDPDRRPQGLRILKRDRHQRILHEGKARLKGQAPHALDWTLGVRPGQPPLLRLRGERIVGG